MLLKVSGGVCSKVHDEWSDGVRRRDIYTCR